MPDILQAAYNERERLIALLRSHPDFHKLEAVLRIIDLYEWEAEAHARADPIVTPAPQDSNSRPPPQPAEIFGSPRPDPPGRASRPRWKWGNSQCSRIQAAAADYLRQKGKPATGGEIYTAIASKGVEVTGKNPVGTVCARLSASEMFDHSRDGYGLRVWTDDSPREDER